MSRPWTDEEIGFLQDHPDWTGRQLADELGRSISAIENARHKLRRGWMGNQTPAWTEEEDQVLIGAPPNVSAESLAELLPSRGVPAIRKRRLQLGIKVLGNRPTEIGARPLVAKTCKTCGLLLAGSWFASVKAMGVIRWHPDCKRCASAKASERANRDYAAQDKYAKRLQSVTVERAARAGEPYTEADYEILADQTLTDFQKALRLQRSWQATSSARRAAGFKSKPDGLGDPERDLWIIRNPNLCAEGIAS